MLRTEIINLLAEKAEVPQIEAPRFMELFLYKLSELLLEGDRFKISGFGDFVISSRQKSPVKSASGKIFQFTPVSGSEAVTFGVPPAQSASANPLDEYFTLGINSKFIPIRGETISIDGLPQNADEMRKFLDQHAGILLQTGTFLRAQRANIPESDGADEQLSKETFLPFNPPKPNHTAEILPAGDETSWEFGNDWKKEYEEDLLLDAGGEHAADLDFDFKVTRQPDALNWDFGPDEEPLAKNEKKEEKVEPVSEESKDFDLESFAPVRALTRELEIDLSELDEDEEREEEREEEEPVEEEEDYEDDIIPEDFDALFKKSLAENVLSAQMVPPETTEEEDRFHINESELEEETAEIEEPEPSGEAHGAIDLRGVKLSRQINPEDELEFSGIRDTIEQKSTQPQKSYVGYYVLAFILLTGAGALVYAKLYGVPSWAEKYLKKKEVEVQLKASPTDIERDYAFPVSYPYERVNVVMTPQPVQDSAKTQAVPVQETPKQEPPKQEPAKIVAQQQPAKKTEPAAKEKIIKPEPKPVADKGKKITSAEYKGAFIESLKGGFEIQVMSLGANDKASAEKAAARLRSQGFNSFIAEKEIPKRGVVNRVRVGPFSSQSEAEKALRKIKGE